MMQKPVCPLNDYTEETCRIRDGLRPLLAGLAEQSILAGNIDAAAPLVDDAASVIAGLFVEQIRVASVASFNEGVSAGLLRNQGGSLQ